MESKGDIENQWAEPVVFNARSPEQDNPKTTSMCGLTAFSVVGKIANIIRMIICIGLIGGAILMALIALSVITATTVLWVAVIIAVAGSVTVAFDSSMSQWLIQKVLNRLSADVSRLEEDIETLSDQLKEGQQQLNQRQEQIKKQEQIISDLATVKTKMGSLINTLTAAQANGEDMNRLFEKNLGKFDKLLEKWSTEMFADMDINQNGVIDFEEFEQYTNK